MKWRLSLEGASVLTARADRMENVCVMQRVTRGVCSDTHLSNHTHTHADLHREILRLYKYHCILSVWL